jgi:choline dehydrogenase
LISEQTGHGFNGYIDLNINPEGIAAQDVKLMAAMIGAAKGFGVADDKLEALSLAVNQTVQAAIQRRIADPHSELLPLNITQSISDALGALLVPDINSAAPDRDTKKAFARLPETMDNTGYRRSSPRDYVYNTVTAKNPDGSKKYKLDVALNTLVTKVTFAGKACPQGKPKANGVEYLYGQSLYRADPRANNTDTGKPGSVKATKEVIVAGGAFNSPQLLKLSGVGPKAEYVVPVSPMPNPLPSSLLEPSPKRPLLTFDSAGSRSSVSP